MSADLQAKFEQASQDVTKLSAAPDNAAKLQLYSLFKQGTMGDYTNGKKPGMLDIAGKFKYESWKQLEGLTKEEAMQKYIDFVAELQAADAK